MVPLSQVTSMSVIETSVSVAGLMEMVQVRVRGVVLPANSGPGGNMTVIAGVETRNIKKKVHTYRLVSSGGFDIQTLSRSGI